jgi:hypothetical protein
VLSHHTRAVTRHAFCKLRPSSGRDIGFSRIEAEHDSCPTRLLPSPHLGLILSWFFSCYRKSQHKFTIWLALTNTYNVSGHPNAFWCNLRERNRLGSLYRLRGAMCGSTPSHPMASVVGDISQKTYLTYGCALNTLTLQFGGSELFTPAAGQVRSKVS